MALASGGLFVATQGITVDSGSGLTSQLSAILTGTLEVGDLAILCVAVDTTAGDTDAADNSIVFSVEDDEANTWVKIAEWTNNDGGTNGCTMAIYQSFITTQVLASLQVAANIDGAAKIGKACCFIGERFTGAIGTLNLADSVKRAYHGFNNPAALTISNPGNVETLYIRADAIESQLQTMSVSSGYTKFAAIATNMIPATYATGSDNTSLGSYAEFKIVTNAGSSSDPGYSNYIVEHSDVMVALIPPTNTVPVLNPIGMKHGTVGTQISFTVSAVDPDPGDVMLYVFNADSIQDVIGTTLDSATGEFTWTPTKGGTYTIRFTVSDILLNSDYEDVVFKIHQPQAGLIPSTGTPAHMGKVPSSLSAARRGR